MGLIILTIFFTVIGLLLEIYKFVKSFFANKVRNDSFKNSETYESFEINESYLDEASKKKMEDNKCQISIELQKIKAKDQYKTRFISHIILADVRNGYKIKNRPKNFVQKKMNVVI